MNELQASHEVDKALVNAIVCAVLAKVWSLDVPPPRSSCGWSKGWFRKILSSLSGACCFDGTDSVVNTGYLDVCVRVCVCASWYTGRSPALQATGTPVQGRESITPGCVSRAGKDVGF